MKLFHSKRFQKILVFLCVGLVFGLGGLFTMMQNTSEKLTNAANKQLSSYKLATELRQSSDDLTRLVRLYVATAKPQYEKEYQNVLDIRNGEAPRPDSNRKISLKELMKNEGFTSEEFKKLDEAESLSNSLAVLEKRAFDMIKNPMGGV